MPETVYTDADVIRIRTDEVKAGDLMAAGRARELGGYTARRVGIAGPAGWKPDWGQEVWRIEMADGFTCQQPGHFPVLVVRGEQP